MEALKQAIKAVGDAIDAVSALEGDYPKSTGHINRLFAIKADLIGEHAKRETIARSPKGKKKQIEAE